MPEIDRFESGTFCWCELATPEPAGGKEFYTSLFGWTAEDSPAGPAGTYTTFRLGGKAVAALYQQPEEQRAGGIPPNWLSHVAVDDVDARAKLASKLGGQLLMEPFDVMEYGRMAVLSDPGGAVLSMWQQTTVSGAELVRETGAMQWNELATRDVDRIGSFYAQLFDWDLQKDQIGPNTYTTFRRDGDDKGGMMGMDERWGEIPSHWMVYFAVDDCDATAAKAEEAGGKVQVPPTDIPSVGRFSVVSDPQGAHFSLLQLAT